MVCHVISFLQEMKEKVRHEVHSTALPAGEGVWQSHLHKLVLCAAIAIYCLWYHACRLVLGYLVHHSYTNTAEAFASRTGLPLKESVASMRNRQCQYSLLHFPKIIIYIYRDPKSCSTW